MKIKRTTKLISERERKVTVAINHQPVFSYCAACNSQSEMFAINEAALRLGTDWRRVVHSIDSGELHSTETEAGAIYICLNLAFSYPSGGRQNDNKKEN